MQGHARSPRAGALLGLMKERSWRIALRGILRGR
jgi:hypothetical protein